MAFTICLVLNLIQMAIYYEDASAEYNHVLDIIN
jgi:hypothetical protein